ncbi:MAG: GNAT family N-acetyltransferase [Marmoricola sp.]
MNMVLIHAADPGLLAKPLAQIAQRACPSLLMFARRRQGHLCSTPREVAGLVAAPLHAEHPGPMSIWLLEVDIEAVSTVTTCRVQDTVSVWCMATPTRHARRGYGKALLASVQESAHQDGAVLGLLGATPAGLPLYDATGWQTQETWDLYTGAASAQFSA